MYVCAHVCTCMHVHAHIHIDLTRIKYHVNVCSVLAVVLRNRRINNSTHSLLFMEHMFWGGRQVIILLFLKVCSESRTSYRN